MQKKIIKTYPYPLNHILDSVVDYIVVYFNEIGEIIDYNEMFNEVYKIKGDKLQLLNIEDLVLTKNREILDLSFDEHLESKRLSVELNKKYTRNPINNTYDSHMYKLDGMYCLIGKKDFHDSDELMNDMSLLTNQLSNLSRDLNKKNIALVEANRRIENLLRHDDLTGLSNRRHFMEYVQKEMANANRYKNPLSLVMCDLDSFKEVNDTYGHDVGDLVLKAVGKVLANETRAGELAARIGGDEFAIVLTQTSLEKGKIFMERIRNSVNKICINEILMPITLSMGITELKEDESFDTFFKRADTAMYKAKKSGKNKVYALD